MLFSCQVGKMYQNGYCPMPLSKDEYIARTSGNKLVDCIIMTEVIW